MKKFRKIFLTKVVSNLNITQYEVPSVNFEQFEDPVVQVIEQCKNHPSILFINAKFKGKQFSFQPFSKSETKKGILNLDNSKACQESDMPTKVIKVNSDIFADILYEVYNRSLEVGTFPSSMKLANVTPVYKKGSQSDKGNYRPVSILPNLSRVFERCVYKQISKY